MRPVIATMVCLVSVVSYADDIKSAPLQGVWFGVQHAERIVLIVRDDKMTFIHPTGPATSSFRLNDEEIDIDRYDGKKQVGIYRSDATTLTLTLADPGQTSRPEGIGVINGRTRRDTAMFTRTITTEGLQTLQANLKKHPELSFKKILD